MIGAGAPRPGRPFVTEAGSVPMNPKFESTLTPSLKRMIALCAIAVALAACSRDLSAQATRAAAPTAAAPAAAQAPGSPSAPAAEPVLRGLPDFSQLVDRYGPAVVNVEVVEKAQPAAGGPPGLSPNDPFYDFFRRFGVPGPEQGPRAHQPPARGAGSGFIVNSDGYILTNTHVVANADEVTVRLTDRREFPAKVIGADERTDVAVIKISATNLPIVKLGDPSRIKPGQWVLAISSPSPSDSSGRTAHWCPRWRRTARRPTRESPRGMSSSVSAGTRSSATASSPVPSPRCGRARMPPCRCGATARSRASTSGLRN